MKLKANNLPPILTVHQGEDYVEISHEAGGEVANTMHPSAWSVELYKKMVEAYNAHQAFLTFIESIARMKQDGEEYEGEFGTIHEYVMENDDAIETVNDLISKARELIAN